MVAIPQRNDPTLAALNAVVEAEHAKQPRRNYLGASILGGECPRALWYDYTGAPREPFGWATINRFNDGHRSEDVMANMLRMVPGIELETINPETGGQFGFELFGGKIKGHCDGKIKGLLQAPTTKHIWEHKCVSEKSLGQFRLEKSRFGEKAALKNWNKVYFVQAQVYMHQFKLDRHYLTVSSPGCRDYDSCRTEYDPTVASFFLDRAYDIVMSKTPPPKINQKPDFFVCKMCSFAKVCHGEQNPASLPTSRDRFRF